MGTRKLERLTHRSTRLAVGVCFAVLAAGQVQLFSSAMGSEHCQAIRQASVYDTTVLQASGSGIPESAIHSLLDSLPEGASPAWITYSEPNDPAAPVRAALHATCDTLTAIDLSCGSGQTEVGAMTSLVAQQVGGYTLDGSIDIKPLSSDTPTDVGDDTPRCSSSPPPAQTWTLSPCNAARTG